MRGRLDSPFFYPKCQQPQSWSRKLDSAARPTLAHSTVTSQDTGMAMTLTGYRASPTAGDADGTVRSGLQAPTTRPARTPGMRRIARYPGGPGSCHPTSW